MIARDGTRGGPAVEDLPLLVATPSSWAAIAAANLPVFLADHAVCEQQAALTALHLVAHYPEDDELVRCMSSLAAEEATHLRRVARLLHDRGLKLSGRRPNLYVQGLRDFARSGSEPERKIDRLLVGALIEARSCERFTRLLEWLEQRGAEPELTRLLGDLGPAERRHWEMFYALAARQADPGPLESRWAAWLDRERELMTGRGIGPTVHG